MKKSTPMIVLLSLLIYFLRFAGSLTTDNLTYTSLKNRNNVNEKRHKK